MGSPLQAAGDKPQKARTENKQKPCSHKFWFDRLGRWGAARRVPERNSPEQSGGWCQLQQMAQGPTICPPHQTPIPISPKKLLLQAS